MNLFSLLIPMWVLIITILFSLIVVDARRPESSPYYISRHVFLKEEEPISQFSSMEDESSAAAKPEVRVVHHHDLNKRILIALIVSSTFLGGLLLFLSCFWIYRHRKLRDSNGKSQKEKEASKGLSLSSAMVGFSSSRMGSSRKGSVAIFDYQTLEAATNKFGRSNVLSEGGSGIVYKALLDEKVLVAVKKVDVTTTGSDAERKFNNEVKWLSKIWHQNIIKLLGYCIHNKTRFLVYEMMQNGSLETQLHGPTQGSALTWHLRLKIAVDVARGLEYLHENCNPPVVHRDLQLCNILLDYNFSAKLSHFGIAVTSGFDNKDNIEVSETSAYVAPEYILDGKLTDKSDVYAFGVVLFELLIGRKLVEYKIPDQNQSLVKRAMPQLTDRTRLPNVVDPAIKDTMDLKHLYQVAAVAVLCVQPEPSYRPLITDVLHSLIPLVPLELGGSLRVTEPISVCSNPYDH
ncbi:probable receptor-like protein kinase At1g80640 isoform X3 [Cannabis sativa]|uniref:probable receptor-like protein kinase At1g80640 isoform X3 n=1 Tax=Cannabis sativa TaxID=3483 RepID=UPI0029CA8395|nr:probable receptor-like protein kinase At1g80640 isoform X3 [Cannabis sativa]